MMASLAQADQQGSPHSVEHKVEQIKEKKQLLAHYIEAYEKQNLK